MPTRPSLRRLIAVLAVCCATVACSDDDDAPPSADPSSTSTTAPATSTTRTVVQLSVVVSEHGVLGSWEGGRWVQAQAGSPSPFAAGQPYSVVHLSGPLRSATAVGPGDESEFCNAPQVVLDPPLPGSAEIDDLAPVAVHGVPDPQIRPVAVLDPGGAVYRDAAAEVLADLAVEDGDPDVVQVVRADLSGDGTDEVLVVAEQVAQPQGVIAEPGDYSVLFLRQVVDGEVRTTVIDEHRSTEESGPYLLSHRVGALADLNGDGALEVVVQTQYYEGAATQVYELGAGGLEEVLAAGCGV